ncbi:hypothetical protein MKX03_034551 [Papaver bracteatum]|nr:hypothetical protein MKX03_034551 [Papaver bracteatum]
MVILSMILKLEATKSVTYIVHMDKDKVDALDQMLGDGKRWYETVIDSIGDSDTDDEEPQTQLIEPPELLYVYENTVSGFAAKLSPKQVETLNKVDGFLSATPDDMFSLHTTHTPQFLGNGQVFKGSSLYHGIRSTKSLPLVYGKAAPNRTDQDARYCISGSLSPKLVKGKIVVCQRGINSRTRKGEQVEIAGGMGMLLLNSEDEGEELFADPHILPATSLDYLNYICTLNYTSSQIALLARRSYSCPRNGLTQAGDLNYPSFALNFVRGTTNSTITCMRTVTNVGNPKSNYRVQVSQPDGVMINVRPKKLKFKKVGQKLSYKVSFMPTTTLTASSFGSLVWASGKHSVRSPIAINWL